MATQVLNPKSSRLDLRMTDEQKRQIERAADISGASVSQWSVMHLVEAARRDIAEHESMVLSEKSFDAFLEALEGAPDPRFSEFVAEPAGWRF